MPLHRVIDLAMFVCRTKQYFSEDAYKHEKLYDGTSPQIDRIALQGSAMNVAVCTDNERIDEDIRLLRDALARDDELLGERLVRLSAILKGMGY
jgi:hypothetical protein